MHDLEELAGRIIMGSLSGLFGGAFFEALIAEFADLVELEAWLY
jgi:hypothetical protein